MHKLAEELERKIFAPREIAVNRNLNTGQGNQTLNGEHKPTRRGEPSGG